ncbi:hypothetical protein JHV666_22910 [Mycobacterium avium subsp. hominissuis]|nr:hypothetical protein MAH_2725 [Mycobacterium avium subsp. hominissuis TH135]
MAGGAIGVDVAGGSDEAADVSLLGCDVEQAASPTAASAVAALNATDSARCIQSVGRLGGSGRCADRGTR